MAKRRLSQVKKLLIVFILILVGLYLFKIQPMKSYGNDILFDASGHIAFTVFILYGLYFFIDQNKSWRIPYLIFSFAIITIISLQRIIDEAHNDVGLLMGLLISVFAIFIANWKELKRRIEF